MRTIILALLLCASAMAQHYIYNPFTKKLDRVVSTAITDDGTDITVAGRNLKIGTALPSTQGQTWSTTHSVPGTVDNGLTRVFRTRPTAESKRIVIVGSSVAYGSGATVYANSWAGRFTTAMEAKGYTVFNVAIGGNTAQNVIDRFHKDVAPLLPDFVVIGLSPWNEGFDFAGAEAYSYRLFVTGIQRLIKMTEGINAIPVVAGSYPKNTAIALNRTLTLDLFNEMERYGVQFWDFFSPVEDGTGKWIAGLDFDTVHPNDTASGYMFDAIPLTFFDMAHPHHNSETASGAGVWAVSAGTTLRPLQIDFPSSASSWTVAFWARNVASCAGCAWWGIDQDVIRLKNQTTAGTPWVIADNVGDVITSAVDSQDGKWHHFAVTYKAATTTLALYIDGASIGTWSHAVTPKASFAFGTRYDSTVGAAVGGRFAQIAAYRTCLEPEDVKALTTGYIPRKSLEAYLPLNAPPGYYAVNLADTATRGTVNGALAADVGGFQPPRPGQANP